MTERLPARPASGRLQPVSSGAQPQLPAPLASTFLSGEVTQASDAVAVLRWGLRRYAWLVLLCVVVVGVLLPLNQLGRQQAYTSESLVVAVDLTADLKVLPRYGAAIFDNGQVAREISDKFGDAGDPEDVVPRRTSLVTEQDSLIMHVQGHARDAQTSADIANAAAAKFAEELNKAGAGVGTFAVQSPAIPPVESDEPLRAAPYSISVGLIAGLMAGLGLLTLLLVLRRPVVDPNAATKATDLPVFGTVTLPRAPRSAAVAVDEVSGLAPLCRQVLDWSPDTVVLTGPETIAIDRHHLARALADAFERVRHVSFAPVGQIPEDRDGEDGDAVVEPADRSTRSIAVIDGSDSIDLVAPGPRSFVLLVVPVGLGVAQLRNLAGELKGVPTAVVLLRTRRRRRRRAAASRPAGRRGGSADPERAGDPLTAGTTPSRRRALPRPREPRPSHERPTPPDPGEPAEDEQDTARPVRTENPPAAAGPTTPPSPLPTPEAQASTMLEWVAAEAGEWFPTTAGSGASLRIVRRYQRPRCRLYEVEVRGGDYARTVVVKARVLDPAVRRRDKWAGQRPVLSVVLDDLDDATAAQAEYDGLLAMHRALARRPQIGMRSVQPYGLNLELAALCMQHVAAPTLREVSQRAAKRGAKLPYSPTLPWDHAGAWLRRYHTVLTSEALPVLRGSRAEVVDLLQRYGTFIGEHAGGGGLVERIVDAACEASELFLGDELATVALHGDFVARNIFVLPDGSVSVIDPFPVGRSSPLEDLGRLMVGARIVESETARPDPEAVAAPPRASERALLAGYFGLGADVPVGPLRVFLALCTLDRWADTLSKEPANPVRRQLHVAHVTAMNRWYRRELRSQLPLLLPNSRHWRDTWV